jgi:hydroxyacylglutathione hydrolase
VGVIIEQFLCRTDNYGYLVHDVETRKTVSIDAPDAAAIQAGLDRRGWTLSDILITHHHRDHVEAIPQLKTTTGAKVWGPRAEASKIFGLDELVDPGQVLAIGAIAFEIIATPGHTLGQIAYIDLDNRHAFTADALFSLGCGRMFEGKPGPMWEGLKALRDLPEDTLIYCGHEYTEENARFSVSVDPNNTALRLRAKEVARMRAAGQFTIPVSLKLEKATNPFLRADEPALAKAMGLPDSDGETVFAALRRAKDVFK